MEKNKTVNVIILHRVDILGLIRHQFVNYSCPHNANYFFSTFYFQILCFQNLAVARLERKI